MSETLVHRSGISHEMLTEPKEITDDSLLVNLLSHLISLCLLLVFATQNKIKELTEQQL